MAEDPQTVWQHSLTNFRRCRLSRCLFDQQPLQLTEGTSDKTGNVIYFSISCPCTGLRIGYGAKLVIDRLTDVRICKLIMALAHCHTCTAEILVDPEYERIADFGPYLLVVTGGRTNLDHWMISRLQQTPVRVVFICGSGLADNINIPKLLTATAQRSLQL